MKAFVISLICLTALTVLITINGIFMNNMTASLASDAEKITLESDTEFYKLLERWEKYEMLISLTVSHRDVDNVSVALKVLEEKYKAGETSGFYESRAMLTKYIEEIGNKERAAINNIF